MKIYYAHCLAIYNTPQEARDLAALTAFGFTVMNPNSPETQKAVDEIKAQNRDYMSEFKRLFIEKADAVAFRALPDGSIPAGVAKELDWAVEAGLPIIELPSGLSRRRITLEQTREYLHEVGQR